MDEYTWVHPDSRILFGAKQRQHKQKSMDPWEDMEETQMPISKWKKSVWKCF